MSVTELVLWNLLVTSRAAPLLTISSLCIDPFCMFKVGAHNRHVCHCFCFFAADFEVTYQEAKHAVGLFHNPPV